MKYLFKCLFLLFIVAKFSTGSTVSYMEISIVLILTASNIIREKYINSVYVIIAEGVIVTYALTLSPYFGVFYGIICYDMVVRKKYLGVLIAMVLAFYMIKTEYLPEILLIMGICTLLSYLSSEFEEKGRLLKDSYDSERNYRYELEQTKVKLMNSLENTAHIAEVKERNRIAREVHDNVGHSIAGVLMQLQASFKIHDRDEVKALELLSSSIKSLSEALTLLKNTVYNIKPKEELGIAYIEEIIKNFSFCTVEFKHSGNFGTLEAGHIEILANNIKEALTNASKYSKATKINISLDVYDKFIRLYYKDNGVGCEKIKESLGLSGMKERIRNTGGNISINGEDGFLIVCIIPHGGEAGKIFENPNS